MIMTRNPIAILARPSLAFLMCFGVVVLYGMLMLGAFEAADLVSPDDCSRVELLR